METSQELRRKADILDQEERDKERIVKMSKKKKFIKDTGIEVYTSDDYCGLELKGISFYYGYEETDCPKHSNKEECEEKDCEEREWCFVAKNNGKVVTRMRRSEIHPEENEEPFWYLVAGIGHYLR